MEDLAEDGLAAEVNEYTAELKSLDSNIVHARNAVELLRWQLKETIGGYTGCFIMILTCGVAVYFGNRLGGKSTTMLWLIVGGIISLPVYHFVNRFAPSRAESRTQKQIEQKLQQIELSENQSRNFKEGLAKAQHQLTRFRSPRDCKTSGNASSGR